MSSPSLTLATQTLSFISFSITLLTLLGVYRDLLSTLRRAPTQIPLILGNLRQEILAERAFLRQRCREGRDPFGVFPGRVSGLPGGGKRGRRSRGEEEGYARLLEVSLRDLWVEFKALERPFLVGSSLRAEAVAKGDYWGSEDVEGVGSGVSLPEEDEKGGDGSGARRRRKRRNRRARGRGRSDREEWEAAEEDLRREGAKYYRTNMTHRFIWWQTKSDVLRLADAVQRIQMRRVERDVFETDELVRILIRAAGLGDIGVAGRPGGRGPAGSGTDSEDDIEVDSRRKTVAIVRSRAGSTNRGRDSARSRSRGEGAYREVEEREVVSRRVARPAPSAATVTSQPRRARAQSDNEANMAARRRSPGYDTGTRSGQVEYEVLRPGRHGQYVVVDTLAEDPTRRPGGFQGDGDRLGSRSRSPFRSRGR